MSADVRDGRTPRVLAWLLILLSAVSVAHGKSNGKSENRFLIIVETSHAAGKRSKGIASTVESLLTSGIQGQAQPDDTIGIWTYNDTLTAGAFPLQTWSDGAAKHIASGMLTFLGAQKFAHSAHFSAVMPTLMPIVQHSEYLNVIIICTGSDPIRGTPFDDQIQKSLRAWRDEQQKAAMPLVVALSVVRGHFTAFRVTPAPWRVELPPLPSELVQARRLASTDAADALAKPTTVAPLIVTGKHRDAPSTPRVPAIAPSVPQARLETNLSIQPNTVIAAASTGTVTETSHVTPDTGRTSTSAIAAASTQSQAAQVTNIASAETKPSIDQNTRSTNCPAAPALATAGVGPAIALPSPRESSVLVKRLILLAALVSATLGIFLVRRSSTGPVSLITHSINRERE